MIAYAGKGVGLVDLTAGRGGVFDKLLAVTAAEVNLRELKERQAKDKRNTDLAYLIEEAQREVRTAIADARADFRVVKGDKEDSK